MAEIVLDFQHQASRPALGIAGLPGQDLLGEGVHASRGLAGPYGAENGHSGIEAALRDNEPSRVARFDVFDRVIDLPDHDSGAGIPGLQGPLGQLAKRGQIAAPRLKLDPPDRDEKQPADQDCGSGNGVVSADNPGEEVGGVIEHQVEHWIVAGQGERPAEETPSGEAKSTKDEERIAPFHEAYLRRVSARLAFWFRVFPQG